MSEFKRKLATFAIIFFGLLSVATPALADFDCGKFAGMFNVTLNNGKKIDTIGGLPQICTAADVGSIIIRTLFGFAGIVAVIFIMIGGYWYLTAAGNEEQSEKGRKALTSAVIGLAVILMSYAIVTIVANFITNKGSGTQTVSVSPANQQTTTTGGGGGGNPPAAEQGAPLSNDPTNMYHYITDVDVRNDENKDAVSGTVSVPTRPGTSNQFVSRVTSGNKQAILNIYKACGSQRTPSFGFFSLGTSRNDVVVKPYYESSKEVWVSDPVINRGLENGEYLQFQVCGQPILKRYP